MSIVEIIQHTPTSVLWDQLFLFGTGSATRSECDGQICYQLTTIHGKCKYLKTYFTFRMRAKKQDSNSENHGREPPPMEMETGKPP